MLDTLLRGYDGLRVVPAPPPAPRGRREDHAITRGIFGRNIASNPIAGRNAQTA